MDQEPKKHDDQRQYNQSLSNLRERYSERHKGEIRLPERRNVDGHRENRVLEIQDFSRFVYNWKISFGGKSAVCAEDFLTRLKECHGITPINDEDLLRALPLLFKDVPLLWFRISKNMWWTWSEFKTDFRRRFGEDDLAARVREQMSSQTQGLKEKVDDEGKEKEVICFRCQKPCHFQIGCPLPRKLVSYRCETEGYTTQNYHNC